MGEENGPRGNVGLIMAAEVEFENQKDRVVTECTDGKQGEGDQGCRCGNHGRNISWKLTECGGGIEGWWVFG